jgi:hypothetical protein
MPVTSRPKKSGAAALVGVFDSQISGGKRHDLATTGRRVANATCFASHGTDQETALSFAMDLTPLVENSELSIADYIVGHIDRFRLDVQRRLTSFGSPSLIRRFFSYSVLRFCGSDDPLRITGLAVA